jgi:hypothetical protein
LVAFVPEVRVFGFIAVTRKLSGVFVRFRAPLHFTIIRTRSATVVCTQSLTTKYTHTHCAVADQSAVSVEEHATVFYSDNTRLD